MSAIIFLVLVLNIFFLVIFFADNNNFNDLGLVSLLLLVLIFKEILFLLSLLLFLLDLSVLHREALPFSFSLIEFSSLLPIFLFLFILLILFNNNFFSLLLYKLILFRALSNKFCFSCFRF